MKRKLLTTVALLTTVSFVAPAEARNPQPVQPVTPSVPTQVSGDREASKEPLRSPLVLSQASISESSLRDASRTSVSADRVLQACSQDRADTLPNPFIDVSPRDWAFKALMSMYYCGAYRGSVPPERVKPFLQPQPSQPTSSLTPTEWKKDN